MQQEYGKDTIISPSTPLSNIESESTSSGKHQFSSSTTNGEETNDDQHQNTQTNNEGDNLQRKITHFLTKSQKMGVSLLQNLHSQKEFHNPEILEKMVHNQLSDEYGSHYPAHLYSRLEQSHVLEFTKQQINMSGTGQQQQFAEQAAAYRVFMAQRAKNKR
jgi:hypothetical protein